MNKFDERTKTFEKKFQIDQELKFKVEARSNKYLGEWASSKLGKNDLEKQNYIYRINYKIVSGSGTAEETIQYFDEKNSFKVTR